jgi:geranylgeranyl pyrophosphate synthase
MKRKEFIAVFDEQFAKFLEQHCASVHQHFSDETFQALTDYIKQFHQGGKRIRPYLVYLLHQGFG